GVRFWRSVEKRGLALELPYPDGAVVPRRRQPVALEAEGEGADAVRAELPMREDTILGGPEGDGSLLAARGNRAAVGAVGDGEDGAGLVCQSVALRTAREVPHTH